MCRVNDLSAVICDSDSQDLFRFKKTFNQIGVENVSFETGPQRLSARIISIRPDILLISTAFCGHDGFELGKRISARCPEIIMLFFSSSSGALDQLQTIATGGVGYIHGSNESELKEMLGKWVTVAKNIRNMKEYLHGRTQRPKELYA